MISMVILTYYLFIQSISTLIISLYKYHLLLFILLEDKKVNKNDKNIISKK